MSNEPILSEKSGDAMKGKGVSASEAHQQYMDQTKSVGGTQWRFDQDEPLDR